MLWENNLMILGNHIQWWLVQNRFIYSIAPVPLHSQSSLWFPAPGRCWFVSQSYSSAFLAFHIDTWFLSLSFWDSAMLFCSWPLCSFLLLDNILLFVSLFISWRNLSNFLLLTKWSFGLFWCKLLENMFWFI